MKLFLFIVLFATSSLLAFDNLEMGIPSKTDTIINREGYALGYSEAHEQPAWVTYKLTRKEVKAKRVSRSVGTFLPDPEIPTGSAQLEDYRRSGYARGHIAPAADMAWSETTLKESFYLSNICPQKESFTAGIWADLEQKMRYWATIEGEIYIVTGPVLTAAKTTTIGPNNVTVPEAFYKAVLVPQKNKAIGFYLSHEASNEPFQSLTLTIDALEEKTGLDFFSELPDEVESSIEATLNLDDWKWDAKDIVAPKGDY